MNKVYRLSYIDISAKNINEKYNGLLSLKKRVLKRLSKALSIKKQKAAEAFPAFSGAFGITVVLFTVFGIVAGAERNFKFTIGGEAFLALIGGVGCYYLLKKLSCNK